MHAVGPLLAAGIDWLEGLLPFLFILFWIVSQVVNLVRRVGGNGGRPAAAPIRPPRPPVPGEPPADIRVELERQIEEFLRQTRGGPQPPQAPRPAEPRKSPPPQPRPAASRTDRPRPSSAAPARRAPPALPSKKPQAAERIADRHLTPLGTAGDDIAEHVHDVFDQGLGQRDATLGPAQAPSKATRAAAPADELASALRDPAALRRLILMREILDRPVERWE